MLYGWIARAMDLLGNGEASSLGVCVVVG